MPRDRSSCLPAQPHPSSGFALAEVVVAMLLLAIASISVFSMFAAAMVASSHARRQTVASKLAASRLEQLRALTWARDPSTGVAVTDTTTDLSVNPIATTGQGLASSPVSALDTNTPGYVDFLDASGGWLGNGMAPPPSTVFTRRWRVQPVPGASGASILLQVLVTARMANSMSDPPVLLTTIKTRTTRAPQP